MKKLTSQEMLIALEDQIDNTTNPLPNDFSNQEDNNGINEFTERI